MMDRSQQEWPDGMVLEVVDTAVTVLSPYQHELDPTGRACSVDCPACIWVDGGRV